MSHVLQDILEYACPNEFGKTDDKQETAENVNHILTYEESPTYCSNAASTSLRTIDERELRIIGNDIKKRTINIKEDAETSEDYNMTFEDAQKAVNYGVVHGALAMTTPGDTSMASLKEVEAKVGGAGARVQR